MKKKNKKIVKKVTKVILKSIKKVIENMGHPIAKRNGII